MIGYGIFENVNVLSCGVSVSLRLPHSLPLPASRVESICYLSYMELSRPRMFFSLSPGSSHCIALVKPSHRGLFFFSKHGRPHRVPPDTNVHAPPHHHYPPVLSPLSTFTRNFKAESPVPKLLVGGRLGHDVFPALVIDVPPRHIVSQGSIQQRRHSTALIAFAVERRGIIRPSHRSCSGELPSGRRE